VLFVLPPQDLSEEELTRLREEVDKYTVEGDLRRFNALNIKRLKEIGCYRGRRHYNVSLLCWDALPPAARLPARGRHAAGFDRAPPWSFSDVPPPSLLWCLSVPAEPAGPWPEDQEQRTHEKGRLLAGALWPFEGTAACHTEHWCAWCPVDSMMEAPHSCPALPPCALQGKAKPIAGKKIGRK
jgi:hypothetical protein